MICFHYFNSTEMAEKLNALFLESQKKKHIMVGLCCDLFSLKKQALSNQNGMNTTWPLEPFPLCANHEDFLALVKKEKLNSTLGLSLSNEMRNSLVKLLLMQLVGYLLKKGVALTVDNFES